MKGFYLQICIVLAINEPGIEAGAPVRQPDHHNHLVGVALAGTPVE